MTLLNPSSPFDPYFDFQLEANTPNYERENPLADKRDSDRYSPTLREFHRLLWSKDLPDGRSVELTAASQNRLEMTVGSSSILLSSDRAVTSYIARPKLMVKHSEEGKERVIAFHRLSDTMGGIIIWPSQKIGSLITINGHRGFHSRIADRLDLTLECVRRHYSRESSPLSATLGRYSHFFDLFVDFRGYVDFFLFQDWVASDYLSLKATLPFDDFQRPGIPQDASEHLQYMDATEVMIRARNSRIAHYLTSL